MTREEAGGRFRIDVQRLEFYEQNGLLECNRVGGIPDYEALDLQRLALIHSLLEIGLDIQVLKQFLNLMEQGHKTKEDQIRMLKKQRFRLLDHIHCEQQALDRLDYIISEIRQTAEKGDEQL